MYLVSFEIEHSCYLFITETTIMSSGGTGRGGRGAILLQALAKSSRRPGDSETEVVVCDLYFR